MSMSFKTLKSDWPFIVLTTLVFIAGLLVAAWDFIYIQRATWALELLNGLGLALFVGGTILRQVGKRTLGRYYSYGLRTLQDQKIIQHGVYKYVRHPITLAALIYTPAIPLVLSSVYGFLVMLGIVPLFIYRIGIEEKMLIEKFGDEYLQYMKRTKKLISFIY
ncbi:MAG: isoprenylcysteine carboxylmethyltransferase family protein [Candidatus Bathyarchaeota archaeon]|nr:isoprenylcysteine carboxylmethyltransferase family protein [Candidatus Bathyarchaeota archaeon]